ncbi:hypothetical protein PHYPO_G00125110 [Pangasianodon hypophthalmus]|uniref:Uncharacterized protein n=1 Tax=Pangasianodon hypophthalmus TaxID=310915 RepID=A0A5N5KR80_PANHP|nr:hypothetical protein PHYPO_G00125110 [Pangasianodon hypophthalmus]
MSSSPTRDTSFLNADEASAIETAVRTAVMSILKVFCDVSEKRSHGYEAKLAEAQRENAALRFRLKAAECELQTLRHISPSDYKISAEVSFSTDGHERGQEPASSQSVSENNAVLGLKEEEPFYHTKLFIKGEMTEECSAVNFEYPVIENAQMQTHNNNININHIHNHSVNQDPVSTGSERRRMTRYENVRRYRERIRADPEKYLAWKEKNHLRYLQNRKTINEMPEPMKKLQRKAWREATRRHRAKKLAQAALPATSMSQTPSL